MVMHAQEDATIRKGKIIIETGYSIFGNFSSGGTGIGIISQDGTTASSISVDGGKFVSEDVAIKVKVSHLSIFNSDFTFLSAGPKYYIAGVAPIEFTAGLGIAEGNTDFIGNINGGYAAKLANNIYLEPTIGYTFDGEGDGFSSVELSFALLF